MPYKPKNSKYWNISITVDGKRTKHSTRTTSLKEAKALEEKLRTEALARRD